MNIDKMLKMARFGTTQTPANEARDELLAETIRPMLRDQWRNPGHDHTRVMCRIVNEQTGKEYFVTAWDGSDNVAAWTDKGMRTVPLRDIYEGGRAAVHIDSSWNTESTLFFVKETRPIQESQVRYMGTRNRRTSIENVMEDFGLSEMAPNLVNDEEKIIERILKTQKKGLKEARRKNQLALFVQKAATIWSKHAYGTDHRDAYDVKTMVQYLKHVSEDVSERDDSALERFHVHEVTKTAKRFIVAAKVTHDGVRLKAFEEGKKIPVSMTPVKAVFAVDEDSAVEQAQALMNAKEGDWLAEDSTEFLPDDAKNILDAALKREFDKVDLEMKNSTVTRTEYQVDIYFRDDKIGTFSVDKSGTNRAPWVMGLKTKRGKFILKPAKAKNIRDGLQKFFKGQFKRYIDGYAKMKAAGRSVPARGQVAEPTAPQEPETQSAASRRREAALRARSVVATPSSPAAAPQRTSLTDLRNFLSSKANQLREGFRMFDDHLRTPGSSLSATKREMGRRVEDAFGLKAQDFIDNFDDIRSVYRDGGSREGRYIYLTGILNRLGYGVQNNRLRKEV